MAKIPVSSPDSLQRLRDRLSQLPLYQLANHAICSRPRIGQDDMMMRLFRLSCLFSIIIHILVMQRAYRYRKTRSPQAVTPIRGRTLRVQNKPPVSLFDILLVRWYRLCPGGGAGSVPSGPDLASASAAFFFSWAFSLERRSASRCLSLSL